ncbi:MAG: hypothetical protein EBZ58_13140, partial [Bacteroidetes bacterium]|nr:hypothetical protein [Bacteroidota bacterium]
ELADLLHFDLLVGEPTRILRVWLLQSLWLIFLMNLLLDIDNMEKHLQNKQWQGVSVLANCLTPRYFNE